MEDGNVLIYSIFGELIKSTSMGQEAKDVKVRDAKIFHSKYSTGVAVLTVTNRFFVVNNLKEPKVRRFFDAELPQPGLSDPPTWPWTILALDRHARIFCMASNDLQIITLSEVISVPLRIVEGAKQVCVSPNSNCIAVLFNQGLIWVGKIESDTVTEVFQSNVESADVSEITWCGSDTILAFAPDSCACYVVSRIGIHQEFYAGFIAAASEIDSARVYSLYSQDLFRKLPQTLVKIFAIGSMEPGAKLRLATEEFMNGSHRADEYIRSLEDDLATAVDDCVVAAGMVINPKYQKTLMKAAQFGRAFCKVSSNNSGSDRFSVMCKSLRVLNALKEYNVGIPLTLNQYQSLTQGVIIDRLLQRRLFPLASKMSQFLQLENGQSRILAHWACYKVSQQEHSDDIIARDIERRLKIENDVKNINYCDIAARAADCGRTQLAIRLLESETSVNRQVPLLIKLGQEAIALNKALNSGDRDLAYHVILHLRKNFTSSDFHMLIRKYPLGKVLYESYCAAHDPESLQDWFVQEDDYSAQALHQIERAMAATRTETRQAILVNVQDLFKKAKEEPYANLAEDHYKLLKAQGVLEERLGKSFVGLTLHQTLSDLIQYDEIKFADKLRQDFKLSDRRYAWIKLNTWARTHKWNEIKRYAKQKKLPVAMPQVVKLVKEHGGKEAANEFLSEEYLNHQDRFNLFSEFGMYLEAASAAFAGKNVEALTALERNCVGRDDILKAVQNYKTKLIGAAASSVWRN